MLRANAAAGFVDGLIADVVTPASEDSSSWVWIVLAVVAALVVIGVARFLVLRRRR